MATEWFCKIMGVERGPMSSQELMALARGGRLRRQDLVRKGGTWVRAEMVQGLLFEAPAPPASPPAPCVALSGGRPPLPAKRSIRQIRLPQYWVKVGAEIAGPFSQVKLRQLAAKGKLKPHYLVSEDRRRWSRVSDLHDLLFGDVRPQPSTVSVRSTVWPLDPTPPRPDRAMLGQAYADMAAH